MKSDEMSVKFLLKGSPAVAGLPFRSVKDAILGKQYKLSIVFCGNSLSQKLNRIYRGRNKPTNILAFPLSKSEGEIFLNLPLARREATLYASRFTFHPDFASGHALYVPRFTLHVLRLVIHGMLHLKGMRHSVRMEQAEQKFNNKFLRIVNKE